MKNPFIATAWLTLVAATPVTLAQVVQLETPLDQGAQDHSELWNCCQRQVSDDGRYVTFGSAANNLVVDDTNGVSDAFVYDRQSRLTRRVSVSSAGVEGTDYSGLPSISADGRYVAFVAHGPLDAEDSNGTSDIMVRDLQTDSIARVSVTSSGETANGSSNWPSISGNGRFVTFGSYAGNLVAGTTSSDDVFVHDRLTGTTTLASKSSEGLAGQGSSHFPAVSGDGRYVVFVSTAENLVADDSNGVNDIFVHDRQTATTTRVSVDSSGNQGDGESNNPSVSNDGRYVAFHSRASNLVAGDTNGVTDVFVRDLHSGKIARASVTSNGGQGDGNSFIASISGNGRYVAFSSVASNLGPVDVNGTTDVFVHDRRTGRITLASVDRAGTQGAGFSWMPSISANGGHVMFLSDADNWALDAGQVGPFRDVFVATLDPVFEDGIE